MLDGIGQEINSGDLVIWLNPYYRMSEHSIMLVSHCAPKKVVGAIVIDLDTLETRTLNQYPLPEHCLVVTHQIAIARHKREFG